MHYILDNEGYVEEVSFGGIIECKNNTCSEYTGKVPTGYSSLENWFLETNIRAYKIVDGNLAYDPNRDYKLRILFDAEAEDNRHISKKELGIKNTEEVNPYADLFPNLTSSAGYITWAEEKFGKVGNFPTEEVKLSLLEEQDIDLIELEFIGDNFLPNTATNTSNNGITYTPNIDKTIDISGTATDKSILNLAGTDTSVRHILTFKEGYDFYNSDGVVETKPYYYALFGLEEGISLEFYNYDGTDKTLIGTYKNNDVITFDKDTNVTQVLLTVDKGTSINSTIKPMLKLANLEYPIMPMTKYDYKNKFNHKYFFNNYVMSGTSSAGRCVYQLKPNTKYTISTNFYGSSSTNASVFAVKGNNTSFTPSTNTNGVLPSSPRTITTDANGYMVIGVYVSGNYAKTIEEFDNGTAQVQIEEGESTTEHEINNGNKKYYIDGVSTQETRSGKNLFDYVTTFKSTNKGLTNKINSDGSITVSGLLTGDHASITNIKDITDLLEDGETYIFWQSTPSDKVFLEIRSKNISDGSVKNYYGTQSGYNKITVNKSLYTYDIRVVTTTVAIWGTESQTITSFYQLEKGSSKTSFERCGKSPSPDFPSEIINIYKAGTYNAIADNRIYEFTIDEDLRSVPNVADRLWIDLNGADKIDIERKVGRVVLKGSEDWSTKNSSTTHIRFQAGVNVNPSVDNIGFSNYFEVHSEQNSKNGISLYSSNANVYIWIDKNIASTVEAFKTWLSTHNTEVYYPLATYTTSFLPEFYKDEYEYEEYKNNTTLIDLAGNEFTTNDRVVIRDNQVMLVKNGALESSYDEEGNEMPVDYEYKLLGYVAMPRTYTPYTNVYCHQRVYVNGFKYRDCRNIDISKVDLKDIEIIADIKTKCDFTNDDLQKVYQYINGETELTEEELKIYDVNSDGVITYLDYVKINNMIKNNEQYLAKGTLEINSIENEGTIVLKDAEGNIKTSIGIDGISASSISINGGKVYGEHLLYNGESNEDVELNDDVSNYEYIEIFYKNNGASHDNIKLYEAEGKDAQLHMENIYTSSDVIYTEALFKTITISGSSITVKKYGLFQTYNDKINNVNTTGNYIYITRVVGYK